MGKWMGAAIALGAALPGAIAHAEAGDPYQFAIVAGQADTGQTIVRTSTTTGQSAICPATLACIPVGEGKPVGAGSYRLSSWADFDSTGSRKSYSVTRYDTRSGRIWALSFDGKVASWLEYTFP